MTLKVGQVWLRRVERRRASELDWCHMLLCLDGRLDGRFAFLHESGSVNVMTNGVEAIVSWPCWEEAPS